MRAKGDKHVFRAKHTNIISNSEILLIVHAHLQPNARVIESSEMMIISRWKEVVCYQIHTPHIMHLKQDMGL